LEYLGSNTVKFEFDKDVSKTLNSFFTVMFKSCHCHFHEIFESILKKYIEKYKEKFQGKNNSEIIKLIIDDYSHVKNIIGAAIIINAFDFNKQNLIKSIAEQVINIYSLQNPELFSVEKELDKLIPNELGSMKNFFIKVISTYYNDLHPIIWSQIIAQMIDNLYVELPMTQDEIFQFVSKYILLNSGPFILKILQMIRPILSPELRTKYNLTKLKYPLLSNDNVNAILKRAVNNWDLYKITNNYSASVGHVCIAYKVDNPEDVIVVKIIKPISIAQSCWEYKTLINIDMSQCEKDFVKGLLESNGREMNVMNEIKNINDGYKYYTDNYKNVFGVDLDAKITTIQVKENIIKENIWYAIPMTLAPGVPLSYLVENNQLENDTKYRAKLHRCLDLFIYKFFFNIVQNGYYHGDPHAGNIFFSYEQSQLTLIDFGAVGELDIYKNDSTTFGLLDIIIMSIFFNFDGIFDTLTNLLNDKCGDSPLDKNSDSYRKLKDELYHYKIQNIIHRDMESKNSTKYKNDLFSQERLNDEQRGGDDSIYSYLERMPPVSETVIDNNDILPKFTEVGTDKKSISFPQILEIILKFYASSGINVPIKLSDFYEFQKAYLLLLGVLKGVNYDSHRSGIAIKKAIVNFENINKVTEFTTMSHVIKKYYDERANFNELKNKLCSKPQTGGANYYNKYRKYKTKYLELKHSMAL